jgi:hypothetical protein
VRKRRQFDSGNVEPYDKVSDRSGETKTIAVISLRLSTVQEVPKNVGQNS